MRTEAKVQNREILAVVVPDVQSELTVPQSAIYSALLSTGSGKRDEVKDFLRSTSTDTYIQQDKNNVRRKCIVVYLDTLCEDDRKKIKEGNYRLHACSASLFSSNLSSSWLYHTFTIPTTQ